MRGGLKTDFTMETPNSRNVVIENTKQQIGVKNIYRG